MTNEYTELPTRTTEGIARAARDLADEYGPVRDLMHYRDTAEYANIVAPKLRKIAGYGDGFGRGTYTGHRRVEIDGDVVWSSDLMPEVRQAFDDAVRADADDDEVRA